MVSQRVNAERVMLLAWPRAILMQVAHPLVAAGVAEHSTFADGGFTAVHRLWQTVQAMLALTFGDQDERSDAIDGILSIHYRVRGNLREAVGPFPAGTPYSAEQPELVLWVHVTLLDSMLLAHDALLDPLTPQERDEYCAESAWVAVALGAKPDEVPMTWASAQGCLQRVLASGVLAVGADGRAVGKAVLSPPLGPLAAPLTAVVAFITRAWLPEPIRREYGLSWSERDARRLPRVLKAIRTVRQAIPGRMARWPESRTAELSRPGKPGEPGG
jgi:uncharacterized protein (DUF2236 family)